MAFRNQQAQFHLLRGPWTGNDAVTILASRDLPVVPASSGRERRRYGGPRSGFHGPAPSWEGSRGAGRSSPMRHGWRAQTVQTRRLVLTSPFAAASAALPEECRCSMSMEMSYPARSWCVGSNSTCQPSDQPARARSMGSPHCERLRRQRSTRHLFAACGRFNPELGLRTSDNQRA